MAKINEDRLLEVVDRIGMALTNDQAPLTLGRVLGWLLLHAPEPQSAEALAKSLQLSRGAISMATGTLTTIGLVSKRRIPGDRRYYYLVRPEILPRNLRARFASIKNIRLAVEEALDLLQDEPPERVAALEYIREMYAFLEEEMVQLFERFEKKVSDMPPL